MKVLWIGDAGVSTGFARCTHETLRAFEGDEVTVLGLNYRGDPHGFPYSIYPCWPGGDAFGLGRVRELIEAKKPDVVIVQNDPWNIREYTKRIRAVAPDMTIVGALAVDGKNCRGKMLNDLDLGIFWTGFGLREAVAGGFEKPGAVVPLGVDLSIYKPINASRKAIRSHLGLPKKCHEAFIVGNINRNQPRKRLDLTIQYFAEWYAQHKPDAYLYLHIAPTGDNGYDAQHLMRYYGVQDRLILSEPEIGQGDKEQTVVLTYNAFDVQVSTTQGEGWGLTTMEGMACGVPQIVPRWSALEDWAAPGVVMVECTSTAVTPNFVNVIGGIADGHDFIQALQDVFDDEGFRNALIRRGLRVVSSPEYRWSNIAAKFHEAVEQAVRTKEVPAAHQDHVQALGGQADGRSVEGSEHRAQEEGPSGDVHPVRVAGHGNQGTMGSGR